MRWQPTHIFALLGTTRSRGKAVRRQGGTASYATVDYGLTSMLLRAQLLTARNARFIYLSSFGVSATTRNPYLAARWRMETELRASGLPHIIARPAFITGPDREERRFGERTLAVLTDSLLTVAGAIGAHKLKDRFKSLTGRQLASALVKAALDERYTNVTLDAAELRALAAS